VLVVGCATPAYADTTTPSPAPSASDLPIDTPTPTDVAALVAAPKPTGSAVSYPVEELTAPVQDLVFGEATADGAVVDLGGREFRLATDVLFAVNSAELNARARRELAAVAAKLHANRVTRLSVIGYTDDTGATAGNRSLSGARAEAVRRTLAAALGSTVAVTAAGRGETAPIASNATKTGQALNRRVEIRAG